MSTNIKGLNPEELGSMEQLALSLEYYIGTIYCSLVVLIAIILFSLGFEPRQMLYFLLRTISALFLFLLLFVCLWSPAWLYSEAEAVMPWTSTNRPALTKLIVQASLQYFVIRLDNIEEAENQTHEFEEYNGYFKWGFGPANNGWRQLEDSLLLEQRKGAPLPALWTLEFLSRGKVNGFLAQRYVKFGALYANIFLWLAIICAAIGVVMYQKVIRYGAIFTLISSILAAIACLLHHFLTMPNNLSFYVYNANVHLHCGWGFYVTIALSIVLFVISVVILLIDADVLLDHTMLTAFFNIDLSTQEEILENDRFAVKSRKASRPSTSADVDEKGDEGPDAVRVDQPRAGRRSTNNRKSRLSRVTFNAAAAPPSMESSCAYAVLDENHNNQVELDRNQQAELTHKKRPDNFDMEVKF